MAVTFVVETGAGLPTATSYVAVATATQYVMDYIEDATDWTASSDDQKKRALNVATQFLDGKYRMLFKGTRTTEDQALCWPRYGVIDRDGYELDDDAVPAAVEHATVEVANYYINEGEAWPDVDNAGSVKSESIKIGEIAIAKEYAGSNAGSEIQTKVSSLLIDVVDSFLLLRRA
jgi:hypothetical protein